MEVCWDDARWELVGARLRANEASKRYPATRPNDQLLEPDTMAPSAPIAVDAFPSDRGFLCDPGTEGVLPVRWLGAKKRTMYVHAHVHVHVHVHVHAHVHVHVHMHECACMHLPTSLSSREPPSAAASSHVSSSGPTPDHCTLNSLRPSTIRSSLMHSTW